MQRSIGNQAVLQFLQARQDRPEVSNAPVDAAPSITIQPKLTGTAGPTLQRACACGNQTKAGSKCSECSKKAGVGLQTKLKISEPGDVFEREADRIADQVLATPAHHAASGAPLHVQRLAGQPIGSAEVEPDSVDQALAGSGRPIEPALRQDMEQRFGHDFSQVRVYSGPAAEQSARDVNAKAYTMGHNIVFGEGQYAPHTPTGQHLLAHELTHTIQQSGGDVPTPVQKTPQILNRVEQKGPNYLQRRETGSGLDDPLYMADRRWSSGQGPDDRVTGQRLQNWAIARGSIVIRSDEALMRMQEKDGVESEIVDDIQLLLVDVLRGHNPRNAADTSHMQWGTRQYRPESEQTRLDNFEGSQNAREMAVLELLDHWGPIEAYLTQALIIRYRDGYLEAAGRTPRDMSLETDTEVIKRIRKHPYRHEDRINQGMAGDVVFRAGQPIGRGHIADIYKSLGSGSTGPGTVWVYLDAHPLWYYSGSVDLLNRQTVIGEVARDVAEAAQFAGRLFPFMIKIGGFAMTFSPNPLLMIAGVVLEELGEEGLRDLSGEGRSFKDIAGSAGKEILINLIFNKLAGGSAEGKAASEAAEALEKVAEKAAARIRDSVEKEIMSTEGSRVASAVKAGEIHSVKDPTLLSEGFAHEVKIRHEGGEHIYRRKTDGEWCRWSDRRLCRFRLDEIHEVREGIIKHREDMVPGERVLEETGMKEVPGVPGKAPVESGVAGTVGEAGHAAEVTGRLPKKSKEIFTESDILKDRDALMRGDITLRELVEKYPPEGAAQVFFPTARGAGRYIDHVYFDQSTMFVVFRESKKYGKFTLGAREMVQLEKDLAFLTHRRFKGLRIEWRISGGVTPDTLATLKKIESDTNGLFRYVLDPVP